MRLESELCWTIWKVPRTWNSFLQIRSGALGSGVRGGGGWRVLWSHQENAGPGAACGFVLPWPGVCKTGENTFLPNAGEGRRDKVGPCFRKGEAPGTREAFHRLSGGAGPAALVHSVLTALSPCSVTRAQTPGLPCWRCRGPASPDRQAPPRPGAVRSLPSWDNRLVLPMFGAGWPLWALSWTLWEPQSTPALHPQHVGNTAPCPQL